LWRARTDWARAAVDLEAAHVQLHDALGPTHARTRGAAESLAEVFAAWGKPEEAARWREQAIH
jgi:hypothetical protein